MYFSISSFIFGSAQVYKQNVQFFSRSLFSLLRKKISVVEKIQLTKNQCQWASPLLSSNFLILLIISTLNWNPSTNVYMCIYYLYTRHMHKYSIRIIDLVLICGYIILLINSPNPFMKYIYLSDICLIVFLDLNRGVNGSDTDQIPHYPLSVSLFKFTIQILIRIPSDSILNYFYPYPIGYLIFG